MTKSICLSATGQSNVFSYTQERVVTDPKYAEGNVDAMAWTWGCTPNQGAAMHKTTPWRKISTKRCYPFNYGAFASSREAPGWEMPTLWSLRNKGYDVSYIQVSQPGTDLASDWNAVTPAGYKLFPKAIAQILAARASHNAPQSAKTPDFRAHIIYQGEADGSAPATAAAYASNFAAFTSALRTQLSEPNLHIIVCQTSPASGSDASTVAAAQAAWVAGDAHATLIPSGSYDRLEPHLRNTPGGTEAYGLNMADVIAGLVP